VLRYVVPSGKQLSSMQFNPKEYAYYSKRGWAPKSPPWKLIFESEVRPLMTCPIPEPLVLEVLCTQNVLHVGHITRIMRPPPPTLRHVRRMTLRFLLSIAELQALAEQATTGLGFPNLRRVELQLFTPEIFRRAENGYLQGLCTEPRRHPNQD
jgi:hypothetical protein